jgi:hypothetical protein
LLSEILSRISADGNCGKFFEAWSKNKNDIPVFASSIFLQHPPDILNIHGMHINSPAGHD